MFYLEAGFRLRVKVHSAVPENIASMAKWGEIWRKCEQERKSILSTKDERTSKNIAQEAQSLQQSGHSES